MTTPSPLGKRFAAARLPPDLPLKMKRKPPPLPGEGLLRPGELERYANLLIFAKTTVEGLYSGKHYSRRLGSSAEFVDYKAYVPGDDVSRIDWRIFARHRKLVLRKYREETDMTIYLVVDRSGSMRYTSGTSENKFLQTSRIAASLAYLMIRQGDKAALALFAERISQYSPPGSTRAHLFSLIHQLEAAKPSNQTALADSLRECEALFRKPGRVVVLSDFLDEPTEMLDALSRLTHRGFEILLLQVLDPAELKLPNVEIARFVDMETNEQLSVEPADIRASYERNMQALVREIGDQCDRRRISYRFVSSREPYLNAIEAYLGFRQSTAP